MTAMTLGPYAAFILGAYGTAALIVTAMVAWVVVDHRRQSRALADLEARGVTRRSDRTSVAVQKSASSSGRVQNADF